MKKITTLILLALLFVITGCNKKEDKNNGWDIERETYTVSDTLEHVSNKTCKVILIYGQSNAAGYSYNWYLGNNDYDLYQKYDAGFSNVKINYVIEGNSTLTENQFLDLKLFNTNNGSTFGPEMGLGEVFSETYPNEDIFIIKYAWGGSSLKNEWLTANKNRNIMYNNAIDFTKTNLDYLKSIGYKINIEGICWMQGESDSSIGMYEDYFDNTKTLVSYFRSDLKKYQRNIKFIDAYIEDIDAWPMYKEINEQKLKFSTKNKNNYVIDTIELGLVTIEEPYGTPDIYHYDSMSMVSLGRAFANMIINN